LQGGQAQKGYSSQKNQGNQKKSAEESPCPASIIQES
jgi:hypothetical protein